MTLILWEWIWWPSLRHSRVVKILLFTSKSTTAKWTRVHFSWWSYLMLSIIVRMLRESTIICLLVLILVVSRSVKTIWSEHNHLIIAFIFSVVRLVSAWFMVPHEWGVSCASIRPILSLWWWLSVLAHYRTVYQPLCDFASCAWSTFDVMSSSILLVIEVVPRASIIRVIQIFNTRRPLSLGIS